MWNAALSVLSVGLYTLITITLLLAACHDVAVRTIPNWMPAVVLAAGVLLRTQNGTLMPGLFASSLILAGTMACWQRGWLGGGDVKLLAACGMLVPPNLAVMLLLAVALSGGILAILYLILGRLVTIPDEPRPSRLLNRIWRAERYRIRHHGPLPYASAIAVGTLFVLLKG